jgi:uncharacterized protein YajQ (UPF0234 family)
MPSFDMVSKVDLQTLDNAVNVVAKKSPTVLISKDRMW